jgi:hypothetical protein
MGSNNQTIFTSPMSYADGYPVTSYTTSNGGMTRNGSDPYFQQAGLENSITLTTLNSINKQKSSLPITNLPNDLDFASLEPGLECDVDQVIRQELAMDGQLDFNFGESNGLHQNVAQPVGVTTSMSSSHSWVH